MTVRLAKITVGDSTRWIHSDESNRIAFLESDPYGHELNVGKELTSSEKKQMKFLPPCDATKILGMGYNYKSLIGPRKNYDEPLFFLKPPSSLLGHERPLVYPPFAERVWIEVELAIVIKKRCNDVSPQDASSCIFGYTIGNDVTAVNILGRDHHLARSKGLDGFCPLGPWLVRDLDTSQLGVKSYINDNMAQEGNTDDRVLSDPETVSLLSRYVTLEKGDVILTGTPKGAMAALVKVGDTVRVEIDQIGSLKNQIQKSGSKIARSSEKSPAMAGPNK